MLSEFEKGLIIGLLVGEGHFGGDGRQPQITLRMHTRHEQLLHRLVEWIPGSKLYGPYSHGGRNYYQWMLRGNALKSFVEWAGPSLSAYDAKTAERFSQMVERYQLGDDS